MRGGRRVNFKIMRHHTAWWRVRRGQVHAGRLLLRLWRCYRWSDHLRRHRHHQIRMPSIQRFLHPCPMMIFQDPVRSLIPCKSVKELIGEPLKIYKACKTVTNTMPASPRSSGDRWSGMSVAELTATSWTAAAASASARRALAMDPGVRHLRRAGLFALDASIRTDPESAGWICRMRKADLCLYHPRSGVRSSTSATRSWSCIWASVCGIQDRGFVQESAPPLYTKGVCWMLCLSPA